MRRPSRLKLFVSKWMHTSRSRSQLAPEGYEVPPPPPPKDISTASRRTGTDDCYAELRHEYAACSIFLSRHVDLQQLGPQPPPSLPPPQPTPRKQTQLPVVPTVSPQMLSASEIRRRRVQAATKRNHTAIILDTSLEETRHQEFARMQKDHLERELEEQERRRKLALEEDLRRAAQAKRDRVEREQREEEERRRTIEQRRLEDRERRQRHAQKQKEWMDQINKEAEEEKRRRMEARQHVTEERRSRPLPVKATATQGADVEYAGWVTVQTSDSVAWKRRYCRVENGRIILLKDDKPQSAQVAQPISITSVQRVCERGDGLEELECLPYSFAVSTADGITWSMFTDDENEKEMLVSVIVQLCGL